MPEERFLERVPVAELRKGLYVVEPDRPWHEIPVPFQGFEIATDEELEILRRHCEFVYVERERSARLPTDAIDASVELPDAAKAEVRPRRNLSVLLGGAREPDKERFARAVRTASAARSEATGTLDRAMHDVRLGRSIDSSTARETVVRLAHQVADNASASMWLSNLRDKDDFTAGHSVNVCVLTLAFGMFVGMDRERLERIALGALLHDVGHVRLPDAILSKPGRLDADEWTLMKKHPDWGYEILSAGGDMPQEALDIVRLHHERVDGSGYPSGRRGKDIPLHVRLTGIADVYEAVTSERRFRAAQPADVGMNLLYNESDVLFGPKLSQAFIRCIGIYPVGSLVELDNGALGIVLGTSPEARLQPTVLLVRTPDGEDYQKRMLLNLAADPGPRGSKRSVKRVVNPSDYEIDVPGIVAFEFGVSL